MGSAISKRNRKPMEQKGFRSPPKVKANREIWNPYTAKIVDRKQNRNIRWLPESPLAERRWEYSNGNGVIERHGAKSKSVKEIPNRVQQNDQIVHSNSGRSVNGGRTVKKDNQMILMDHRGVKIVSNRQAIDVNQTGVIIRKF